MSTTQGAGAPSVAAGRGRLIVIAGPSGVGKGAIVAKLLAALPDLVFSVSATTRLPRPGEVDGRDYQFLDPYQFAVLEDTGGFLEWADIFGQRYGTPAAPVDRALAEGRDVLLELDVQGARQVRAKRDDAFMIFLKPPSLEELERRLRSRGTETEDQIRRRLAKASDELEAEPEFNVTIVNDDLETATKEVIAAVEGLRGPKRKRAKRKRSARS